MLIDLLAECLEDGFFFFNVFWAAGNAYNILPFLKKRRERSENGDYPMKTSEKPKISILLPAYKEEKVIVKNVNRIEKSGYSNLELLLITEDGDFKTGRMAEYLSRKYGNIKHVTVADDAKPKGKPRALNKGLAHANGEIVGVIDAEDAIDPGLFDKVAYDFRKYGYDAVQGGLRLKKTNDSWMDRQFAAEYMHWYDGYIRRISGTKYILPFGGSTNFFRKDVLDELGGWENGNLTEDYEIAMRMHSKCSKKRDCGRRYKVGLIDAVTLEETPKDLKGWMKQRTRWSQGKMHTSISYLKRSDLTFKERLRILATGISSFIGTVNLAGISLSAFMYAEGIGMGEAAGLAYLNLASVGAYCYMQGKAYYKTAKEEDGKHPYLDSVLIGISTPAYWALQWVAELRALLREIRKKKEWEKTAHMGTAYENEGSQR